MKRTFTITALLVFVLAFSACSNKAAKLYEEGNYYEAYRKSLVKFQKKKKKFTEEDLQLLETAYQKQLERDQQRIAAWESSDDPIRWRKLYNLYTNINERQNQIRHYLPIQIGRRTASFEFINVQEDLEIARKNVALVTYEDGLTAMNNYDQTGRKGYARNAYNLFVEANRLYAGIENVEQLIPESRELGTTYVLIQFDNRSREYLPIGFQDEVDRSLFRNDERWVKYDRSVIDGVAYDYIAELSIRDIDFSAERDNRDDDTYTRTIEEFVRDTNGSFVTDTLGNRITEDVEVRARVTTTTRSKAVELQMEYRLYSGFTDDQLDRQTYRGVSFFEDVSCSIRGDERALPNGYNCSERSPSRFPSDEDMLESAFDDFRSSLRNRMYSSISN